MDLGPTTIIKKPLQSRSFRHMQILIWKSYVQRQSRWPLALLQTIFAAIMFLMAVFKAKPVFLTSLQPNAEEPLTYNDILQTLSKETIVGFAPAVEPYYSIMHKVAYKLNKKMSPGMSEEELNDKLYDYSKGVPLKNHVIYVIWKPKVKNVWKFSIRCTELAGKMSDDAGTTPHNRHLRVGFLAVQLAVSEVLIENALMKPPKHKVTLGAMPTSPLMLEGQVRSTMAWILLFFTLAFIPPVMEISALVVTETTNRYKRALRIRDVDYSSLYIGWLVYAYLTALPICILASITLTLIFRWIMLFFTFIFVFSYITVMIMFSLITGMFHNEPHMAAIWSALFTLLQLFLAGLLVSHGFNDNWDWMTLLLHILLPPLGLVHGFNNFALLQTGRGSLKGSEPDATSTIFLWLFLTSLYFAALMLLQRTISQERAIGGQVSWKSIIFKKAVDVNRIRVIENPSGKDRDKLQNVDELLAKAISFNNVSKSIMGVPVLTNITMDIYRGEFTMFFTERIQERLLNTIEDLITGLTYPDKGTINVLGHNTDEAPGAKSMAAQWGMIGICHRSEVLVEEFTVLEQLQFFTEICMWNEPPYFMREYFLIQSEKLLKYCELEAIRHVKVKNLDPYYRAQLCWAIALLMEPRIIFVPHYLDDPTYSSVINDKIVKTRTHLAVLKLCFSTNTLDQCDRLFLFDRRLLVFGGTPAYMFFKYGREYRVRLTFRSGDHLDDESSVAALIHRASKFGAEVRAHLGSLLILRLPTRPTDKAAAFVKYLTDNFEQYSITSLSISLADSDEIIKRATYESRKETHVQPSAPEIRKQALKRIAAPRVWERRSEGCLITPLCFRETAWKYVSFYVHYRFFLIITVICAIATGIIIGVSLSVQLITLGDSLKISKMLVGEKMTVESMASRTTLVIQTDNTPAALSVASAYAMSHTNATEIQTADMAYTALPSSESVTNYLMLRAIDSPQQYVYMYAYGLSISNRFGILNLTALYSPVQVDTAAAARSLGRMYTALLRHYSGALDADIEVTDDPLVLDSSPMAKQAAVSPLIIQFMLIITISHITLLPSKEHGLIRHMQAHAINYSPARYWFTLFCCDLILYWMLVGVMSAVLYFVMYLAAPVHFITRDLIVIPFILIVYGLSCVPQAYLFSLGPNPPLNSMTFIITNIVCGEATVIGQILYGQALKQAERVLSLSPQYNVANAFIRTTQIFVYNSECVLFKNMRLCSSNVLHKCCHKCGVMQACFQRISYFTRMGILDEIVATLSCGLLFVVLLVCWEYKVFQRLWEFVLSRWCYRHGASMSEEESGATQELKDATAKLLQIKSRRKKGKPQNTYGEKLLAYNVSRRESGVYLLKNVTFGIGKGQALALVGLKRHGRLRLCELLAGFKLPSEGKLYTMSKWNLSCNTHKKNVTFGIGKGQALALVGLKRHGRLRLCELLAGFKLPSEGKLYTMSKWNLSCNTHKYSRNVALCHFESTLLPPWMTVYDSLALIAVLRGVPKKHVAREVQDYIDALELHDKADTDVCRLNQNERTRANFAAVVVGAPPVLVLDEFTAYQKYSVSRAMFFILYHLRKRGHAIFVSSATVENHMTMTNHLAILLDGQIYDIDHVDQLIARYSQRGYTVVVHLKDEVDINLMFRKYFKTFRINDTTDVLANVQVQDPLNYAQMFERMEQLLAENDRVYTYIISGIPIQYVYNKILKRSIGLKPSSSTSVLHSLWNRIRKPKKIISPEPGALKELQKFEKKYDITTLTELPWSVIFQR